tara:strand:- start:5523 stop:5717 length:195 start_codon:yes stop_codon:yes gene_type:complete
MVSEVVTAYKAADGDLFDSADKALDHDVYREVIQKYRNHYTVGVSIGETDMRPLYELLKGYYDG